jgi:hypothetical protein
MTGLFHSFSAVIVPLEMKKKIDGKTDFSFALREELPLKK